MKGLLLKHATNSGKSWAALSVSLLAAGLLTACGGSSGPYTAATGGQNTQTAALSGMQAANMQTSTQSDPSSGADPSSFTVNSSKNFKGFNPGIWNDQHAWYECDCGSTPRPVPNNVPWNAAG